MTDAERRARLVRRHHLARTAEDVGEAVRGVVAVHSSDPVTPPLACRARVAGFTADALDQALYGERSLWRTHAMRRTLFVVPAEDADVFDGAAARAVARSERRRVEGWLAGELGPGGVAPWMASVEADVMDALEGGAARGTQDLTEAVPALGTGLTVGSGKWTTRIPLSSRLLFVMAMEGKVVRGRPAGTWRSSQYRWSAFAPWFGRSLLGMDEAAARAGLARRYLASHGPATLVDLRWWTGWTARLAARALEDVGAVAVALGGGAEGFVLADDVEPVGEGVPHVSFLPGLDPTSMGWKERAWYMGGHTERLFDRNGNAGPTVWLDGRVVGAWAQRDDGEVAFHLLDDVGAAAAVRVAEEAGVLTAWLDGTVVKPRFRTPLEKKLASG